MENVLMAVVETGLAHAGPSRASHIHGEDHWRRVGANGHRLATATLGGDSRIVLCFAVLHDGLRKNDGRDPGHGPRAAALAGDLGCQALGLDAAGLEVLVEALADHDRGLVTDHPTIGACWDADRLDLWRVGITPNPTCLCTAHARDAETIRWSAHAERELPTWHDLAQAYAAADYRLTPTSAASVRRRRAPAMPARHAHSRRSRARTPTRGRSCRGGRR